MEHTQDPRSLAAAKLASRARRLRAIRRRATYFAAAVFAACWLAIGGHLLAGRDPALTAKSTQQARTAAPATSTDDDPARADDEGFSAPAAVAAPTPVTTSQS